jgi:ribonuclease Z
MARVTITGSGTPLMVPGRAGPGTLVELESGINLQFDVGRATTLRLTEAGLALPDLDAVFITHHHSDHMVGLADLAMSWWLEQWGDATPSLPVIAPLGQATTIAGKVLDVWHDEMTMRSAHTGRANNAAIEVRPFPAQDEPRVVYTAGEIEVRAVQVRHEPVIPAVAYRVDAPAGSVVISGDTAVCPTLERLAHGATLLVQEAFRASSVPDGFLSDPKAIASYHSDPREIGEMANRAGVGTIMLTHVIPPPNSPEDKVGIINDIRRGGYHGPVIVADDLDHIDFSPHVADRAR